MRKIRKIMRVGCPDHLIWSMTRTKLTKLINKRLNPVLIWACDDGIIYGKAHSLIGEVRFGGRAPREGSEYDAEMMVYYEKQKEFKYVRFQ